LSLDELLRERLRCDEDVAGAVLGVRERGDLGFVLGAQLLLGGLLVLQVALRAHLLQQIQALQLEHVDEVLLLGDAVLVGLLREDLNSHEIIERESALLGRQLLRGLAARDSLHVELEELPPDRRAIDGRHRRAFARRGRCGGLLLAGRQPEDCDQAG